MVCSKQVINMRGKTADTRTCMLLYNHRSVTYLVTLGPLAKETTPSCYSFFVHTNMSACVISASFFLQARHIISTIPPTNVYYKLSPHFNSGPHKFNITRLIQNYVKPNFIAFPKRCNTRNFRCLCKIPPQIAFQTLICMVHRSVSTQKNDL